MMPSQSSSLPLQVSSTGLTAPTHCGAPPEHSRTPSLHSPHGGFAQPGSGAPHEPRLVRPSSNEPSQSSSLLLHVSAVPYGGAVPPIAPMHMTVPLMQWLVPATHSPRSVPHLPPPPGSPSSVSPLQSLSLPSQ